MPKFDIDIDGFDKLADITRNIRIGLEKKEILKVLKVRGKNVLVAVKINTPIAKREVVRRLKDGTVAAVVSPGNLRNAMQIIVGRKGRSKEDPTIYIGANVKSNRKFDGWYWFFVVKGTKSIKANDFISEAANPLKETTQNKIIKDLVKQLNVKIDKAIII